MLLPRETVVALNVLYNIKLEYYLNYGFDVPIPYWLVITNYLQIIACFPPQQSSDYAQAMKHWNITRSCGHTE